MAKKNIKVLILMLHGSNQKNHWEENQKVFGIFRETRLKDISVKFYVDSYHFPVWCATLLVDKNYKYETILKEWEKLQDEHGIGQAVGTSYETILDFDRAIGDPGYFQKSEDY